VCFSGIEAVDAEVERAVDRFDEVGFLDAAVAAADFPTAESDCRDLDAGLSERTIFHIGVLLIAGCCGTLPQPCRWRVGARCSKERQRSGAGPPPLLPDCPASRCAARC